MAAFEAPMTGVCAPNRQRNLQTTTSNTLHCCTRRFSTIAFIDRVTARMPHLRYRGIRSILNICAKQITLANQAWT